ncbi:MAG: SDR family oxidoreductase [Betaproteobacteria bacterium]
MESDRPAPTNAYGRTKHHAEQAVLAACPRSLVIRTAAFFGPWDVHNFAHQVLHRLRDGQHVAAAANQVVSPTYVLHLVEHALDRLVDDERGLWHLTNCGAVSWADFARRLAHASGLPAALVMAVPGASLGHMAARPPYTALSSERGWITSSFDVAIAQYLHALAGAVTDGGQDDVTTDHGLHALTPELEEAVR